MHQMYQIERDDKVATNHPPVQGIPGQSEQPFNGGGPHSGTSGFYLGENNVEIRS